MIFCLILATGSELHSYRSTFNFYDFSAFSHGPSCFSSCCGHRQWLRVLFHTPFLIFQLGFISLFLLVSKLGHHVFVEMSELGFNAFVIEIVCDNNGTEMSLG